MGIQLSHEKLDGITKTLSLFYSNIQQPRPHSPTGDLGEIAVVNGQNSEGMGQGGKPGTGKLYTDVAPPTPVGAWSMALGLRQRFEYYYYYSPNKLFIHKQYIPFKVRPFLDLVLENFKSYYQPHQHISIDESMISYKRSSLLHTVPPKKPHKWGLKAWVLADSTNGVAEGIYRLY